jgi:hypothetical protein
LIQMYGTPTSFLPVLVNNMVRDFKISYIYMLILI